MHHRLIEDHALFLLCTCSICCWRRLMEDRQRLPEILSQVDLMSWLSTSQISLASSLAFIGRSSTTYAAFKPTDSVRESCVISAPDALLYKLWYAVVCST